MLSVERVSKSFALGGKILRVLDNISLVAHDAEFITVFGPNGCGKTTLLQIIAGLEQPDSGSVQLDNKPQGKARFGFVFQNYNESLFPWRTVLGNVEFALECRGIEGGEKRAIALSVLKKFSTGNINLFKLQNSFLHTLSGGMKQLVAIARAIAFEPDVLLLDEPFSSLDYYTAAKMDSLIEKTLLETKKTIIFVSHDLDEAIFLADKIIVLSGNKPARIIAEIKVKLPRPRLPKQRSGAEFFGLRKQVMAAFGGA